MKKKILSLGIITVLIIMLFALTGCGSNNDGTVIDNNADKTANSSVDEGEKIIYEFARYVREQDIEKITNVFELAKVKGDDLKEKLDTYFDRENATDYKVTEIFRVENEQDFVENIKNKDLTYDTILKMINALGDDKIVPYIVRGTQAGTEFEDFFYLEDNNGTYKIIHTTNWNFILY